MQNTTPDVISITPELYFSKREKEILIVEPESASWGVLSGANWNVFQRISHRDETTSWSNWTKFSNSSKGIYLQDICYKDLMEKNNFNSLIQFLYRKNFIAINGVTFHDPVTMWKVQKYPHYYNIHMTESCNLGCRYCRVYSSRIAPKMSPALAEKIVRRIMTEIPQQEFLFGPHGGEPLLNIETVLRIAKVSKELGKELCKEVSVSMQTNGILLQNEDYCKVLFDACVAIGVSLDGPEDIHNENRIFHNKQGSFHDVIKGVKTAEEAGHKIGFIAVVSRPENYVRVLDFFVREMCVTGMRINYLAKEGRAKDTIDFSIDRGELYAREWLKIVDYCMEYHKETGIWLDIDDLNLFVLHLISKERPHMCYRSPCGIGNSILGISHEGDIFLCDELVGNQKYKIGNINDPINLKELLDNSPVLLRQNEARKIENIPKCSKCVWRRFHGGPCTGKTEAYYGQIQDDPMCQFYHVIFEELMWKIHKHPEITALVGRYKRRIKNNKQ